MKDMTPVVSMVRHLFTLAALSLLVAGCAAAGGGDPVQQTATPRPIESTATVRATQTAGAESLLPDAAAAATATIPPAGELAQTAGRNADGTFYRGSPDAPVTLFDYSDFL